MSENPKLPAGPSSMSVSRNRLQNVLRAASAAGLMLVATDGAAAPLPAACTPTARAANANCETVCKRIEKSGRGSAKTANRACAPKKTPGGGGGPGKGPGKGRSGGGHKKRPGTCPTGSKPSKEKGGGCECEDPQRKLFEGQCLTMEEAQAKIEKWAKKENMKPREIALLVSTIVALILAGYAFKKKGDEKEQRLAERQVSDETMVNQRSNILQLQRNLTQAQQDLATARGASTLPPGTSAPRGNPGGSAPHHRGGHRGTGRRS